MYKIIDNFLEENEFRFLKENFLYNGTIPWYIRMGVSEIGNTSEGSFLTHMFYWQHQVTSNNFKVLEPLLDKINPLALVRIKANFYPTTKTIVKHDFHIDYEVKGSAIPCKACLFYLNTNNGKTIFKDGDEIESIENRAVFFDSSIYHQSTTCTDDPIGRFNINFNYF